MSRIQMAETQLENILYDNESPTETVFSEEQWTQAMDEFNQAQCLKDFKDSPAYKEIFRRLNMQIFINRRAVDSWDGVDQTKLNKVNIDLQKSLYAERILREMIESATETPRPILAKQ